MNLIREIPSRPPFNRYLSGRFQPLLGLLAALWTTPALWGSPLDPPGGDLPLSGDLVLIPGGTLDLSMGEATVRPFHLSRFETTWGIWRAVCRWAADNGYDIGSAGEGCADDHPVHSVSWYDVVKWCNALSEKHHLTPVYTVNGEVYRVGNVIPEWNKSSDGFRLPAEAEWEFAARGGAEGRDTRFSGSDELDAVAWFWDNSDGADCDLSSGRGTWPVGRKQANELGIHDMSGNVWEWCWDATGDNRRIRGGSWDPAYGPMVTCSVSFRDFSHPLYRRSCIGFRLARNAEANPNAMTD